MTKLPLHQGQVVKFEYPFIHSTWTSYDEDGSAELPCWKPGVRNELIYPDACEVVADGKGFQVLTIISIHKPGKFPTRIFYTRKWINPDGVEFGTNKLHIKSISFFNKLIKGFGFGGVFDNEVRYIEGKELNVPSE